MASNFLFILRLFSVRKTIGLFLSDLKFETQDRFNKGAKFIELAFKI